MIRGLKLAVDIAMIVSMPVLMAYELAGAALHEYLGIAVFFLFIVHHILNFGWIKSVAKGRYTPVRAVNLAVNFLLLIVMLLLPLSGVMMSKHIAVFLNIGAAGNLARTLHLPVSYWGFLLMSFHMGLHWNAVSGAIKKKKRIAARSCRVLPHLAAVAVMVYGGYAFLSRGIADYLFLKTRFAFYDFSEPLTAFLQDYFAVMATAAGIGYYFMLLLGKISHKNVTGRR